MMLIIFDHSSFPFLIKLMKNVVPQGFIDIRQRFTINFISYRDGVYALKRKVHRHGIFPPVSAPAGDDSPSAQVANANGWLCIWPSVVCCGDRRFGFALAEELASRHGGAYRLRRHGAGAAWMPPGP